MSKEEWVIFGRDVFEIDKEQTKKEMEKTMGLSGSFAGGMIVNMVDINQFVDNMFLQADKNSDSSISYDEFLKFLFEHKENNLMDN